MDTMPDASELNQILDEAGIQFNETAEALEGWEEIAPDNDHEDCEDQSNHGLRGFRRRWLSRAESSAPPTTDGARQNEECFNQMWKRRKLDEIREAAEQARDQPATPGDLEAVGQTATMESFRRFRTHSVKLPWESGPLAGVFGNTSSFVNSSLDKMLAMPKVGLLDTLNPARAPMESASVSLPMTSRFSYKRIAASKVVVKEDEMRAKALNQIRTLLLLDLGGTGLGLTISNLAGTLDDKTDIMQVLSDSFATKATGTLMKRVSSFWSFAKWMMENYEQPVWQVDEPILYNHMCFLREEGAAPTRASHLLEALRFFDASLKFQKTDIKTVISMRVHGASHALYVKKRKLQQAKQFSVEAVQCLESLCVSEIDEPRTLISGAVLFCIFACARWSDMARLENVWIDEFDGLVLVEGETSRSKTSRTKEAKARLLPFTALGTFRENESWGKAFVRVWKKVNRGNECCFIPSWNDRSATWASSPMSTSEASFFIKEFLEEQLGPEEADNYSTHSGKPTLLTWCGMTDLFSREERTLLGHHIEQNTRSATTYNRDAQLLLQRKVAQVLKQIQDGILKPDASRAERLKTLVDLDEEGESSRESEESDYHEEHPPATHSASMNGGRPLLPPDVVDEFSFVAHKLTGTIHVVKDVEAGTLACGRKLTMNLESVDPVDFDAATVCFCIQCNSVIHRKSA